MANGDQSAFTAIYNAYWNKLYFLAHKHLKSAAAAEEIVQEVFLQLWKKRTAITVNVLPVYLAAMTRYAVYRALAYQHKRSQVPIDSVDTHAANLSLPDEIDNRSMLDLVQNLSALLPE